MESEPRMLSFVYIPDAAVELEAQVLDQWSMVDECTCEIAIIHMLHIKLYRGDMSKL